MRAPTLCLSFMAVLSLASTVTSAALLPRSLVCANDGKTNAGNLFTRASDPPPSSLHQRTTPYPLPCAICVRNTRIFVVIRSFEVLTGTMTSLIQSTLTSALSYITDDLRTLGDVVVPDGCLYFARNGVRWVSVNMNNHQQTLGVVQTAVKAIMKFMNAGQVGWMSFEIWDGWNQVGGGQLSRAWEGPDLEGAKVVICAGLGAGGGGG